MSMSLAISGHTLVMESLKLGLRIRVFKDENDSNNLTLGPCLGDSITKVWPEIERLRDIFAVTPYISFFFFLYFVCLSLLTASGQLRLTD